MKDKKIWIYILIFFGAMAMTLKNVLSTKGKGNDKYDEMFLKYAQLEGIDAKLLKAIAMNESGQKMNFTNLEPIGGTTGIMHIKLETARDYNKKLTAEDLKNYEVQIQYAAKHLGRLLKLFGNEQKAIMAYNQGEGNTLKGKTVSEYYNRYVRNKQLIG